MVQSESLRQRLPSTAELPCSDDIPVDNEDQNLLPNLLLLLLAHIWADRMDWYFGVDMGVYHTAGLSPYVPVVPDAFLSLNVDRRKEGKSRRSYATWEENDVVPILVLEMVSHKPGGEYDEKMALYQRLGVLYYVIYNPEFWRRDRHQAFEVYKLEQGHYQPQIGEPYWMPEVGIGIGRYPTILSGIPQEILTWYNEHGHRHLSAAEQAQQQMQQVQQQMQEAQQQVEQERQRREKLEAFLRSQGFDPDQLPGV
jgi:Uma2 family endonuclease